MGVFVLGKQLPGATAGQALLAALLIAAAVAAASHRGRSGARRHRHHDHHTRDPLGLPALLVAAPPTARFVFARSRLAQGVWKPAYKLSSGRLWWRCLRLVAEREELHPCAERLAKHLSWHLGGRCTRTDIRAVLTGYAAYHGLSLRTAWTDWGRLVTAGWLAPTRAPANQGRGCPQGPGSGRAARYVLTAPVQVITQLRARARRRPVTSLVSSSLSRSNPPPLRFPHTGKIDKGGGSPFVGQPPQNAGRPPRCWLAATSPGAANAPAVIF